jgi:hypothetical protein
VRTGENREVDLVAEAAVGGYQIVISIEVTDRKRPADVTWVEGMAQKHEDLPTSKLVLWSTSGFSASALAKARALGLETVSPGDAVHAPWASLAREFIGGSVKFVRPQFDPVMDVQLDNGQLVRWPADPAMVLRQCGGKTQAAVGTILNQIAPPNVAYMDSSLLSTRSLWW